MDLSMQMKALRSLNLAKLSSKSSTRDEYWVTSISAGTPAGYCLSQIRSMVFPLWFPRPALIASDPRSNFCFDAISAQISLRNLRKLDCYANRYPLRSKTLWVLFPGRARLVLGQYCE